MLSTRQDNTPRQRPLDRLSNPVSDTFGPTTPETARETPWAGIPMPVHVMTTSTNTRVRAILRTLVLDQEHRYPIQTRVQIRFRARSCRERRVIAGLMQLRTRTMCDQIIIISKVDFRVQVPRPGRRRVVREGVARQRTVVRRKTKLQPRVVSCVHSVHLGSSA